MHKVNALLVLDWLPCKTQSCSTDLERRCAEAFVRAGGSKTFEDIEGDLMNGQKIQGTGTCEEVIRILRRCNQEDEFPLFSSIHKIAFERAPPESMIQVLGSKVAVKV